MPDIIDHSAMRTGAHGRSDAVRGRRHIAARYATRGASATAARGLTSRLEDDGAVRDDHVIRTPWTEAMIHWLDANHP